MSLRGATFEGYDRRERPPGVRNHVLVLPSVICSQFVADRIADRVPGARSAPHDHGCAQIGADDEQTERTFVGVGTNPNVAGTVVVGLGCEGVQSAGVADKLDALGAPVRELSIQGAGGTDECVERGVAMAGDLVADARESHRRPADLGDLTVGIVPGDATDATVDVADPLVGGLVRDVVDAGGRVVVAGIERFGAHPDDAVAAAHEEAAGALRDVLERHRGEPARSTRVAADAAGRSFDSLATAWGGLSIRAVVDYGARATHGEGVAVLDAPAAFEEAATGLAAAGCQLVVHETADGVPTGHPLVPVVKVSGDAETVAALPDDVDVDATAATADDLAERLVAVADGEPSCAESHGLAEFAITRVGPSM